MKIGSLFSGIGGLELGLERAGLGEVAWQVEIDPWCRDVLALHWPNADRSVHDVTRAGRATLTPVDVLCGGFPCQDVSSAGLGAGLAGRRSGLWFEFARVVRELGPRIVIVENVASGKARWLGEVRDELEQTGYRTRAFHLSAADVGAPHRRRRIFVVADRDQHGREGLAAGGQLAEQQLGRDTDGCDPSAELGDAVRARCEGGEHEGSASRRARPADGGALPDADGEPLRQRAERLPARRTRSVQREGGAVAGHDGGALVGRDAEPGLGRVPHGIPAGLDAPPAAHAWPAGRGLSPHPHEPPRAIRRPQRDHQARLAALGNAVVPQQAEAIGRLVLAMIGDQR